MHTALPHPHVPKLNDSLLSEEFISDKELAFIHSTLLFIQITHRGLLYANIYSEDDETTGRDKNDDMTQSHYKDKQIICIIVLLTLRSDSEQRYCNFCS